MNNVSAVNETAAKQQNWCYTAKAPNTTGSILTENGANQALLMRASGFGIQPYKFTTPLRKLLNASPQSESMSANEKELQTSRLMAFGRSLSWS